MNLQGKKTFIGAAVVLLPILLKVLGYEVSEAFPVQFSLYAEETIIAIGALVAIYGRIVANGPAWITKK